MRENREKESVASEPEQATPARRDRQVTRIEEFTEEEIEAISNSKVPEGYEFFNEELKDWRR